MSMPSLEYIGLKKPSTNWINHHVIKKVTATGKRTTLQMQDKMNNQAKDNDNN